MKAAGEIGRRRKIEKWFSSRKSGGDGTSPRLVGELPEAANESLCEDIVPPDGEMPSKVEFGRRLRWVFAPTAVSLLSKVSTVAVWLGCWSADYALTLDT
jgi:hypothetical protein